MLFAMARSTDSTDGEDGTDETTAPSEESTPAETTETDGDETGDEETQSETGTEMVTVTIEYYYADRDGNKKEQVMDPYEVASIAEGTPLNVNIPCRIFPGYEIQLINPPTGVTKNDNEIVFAMDAVEEDTIVTIHYKEIQVSYYARFFVQNVYNDLYTERTDVLSEDDKKAMVGYAGDEPEESLIYPEIPGFTALFHQPDKIAADGSTVFEVYYDRNYYLINFNMDGGYGTAPVYARFETAFNVSQPTRAGWNFAGWDLISITGGGTDNPAVHNASDGEDACLTAISYKDNNADTLTQWVGKYADGCAVIGNYTYKALWTQETATYKVAYWMLDDDGKTTYLGGITESAKSGTKVSGKDDLGSQIICGMEEHIHTEDKLICGNEEHTHHTAHTLTCYSYVTKWEGEVDSTSADGNVIAAANENHEDTSGTYIYVIWTDTNSALWPKVLIDGKYYTVHIDGSRTISSDRLNAITTGDMLATGTFDEYHTQKYALSQDCNLTICDADCAVTPHTHVDSCYSCGLEAHTHEGCVSDLAQHGTYLSDKTDKDVTVEGDGSTVVNVYYAYKKYTLRFYYARSTEVDGETVYSIVGGSTYYFGAAGDYSNKSVEELLANVPDSEWGNVKSMPTINTDHQSKYVFGSISPSGSAYTYYYLEFTKPFNSDLKDIWPVGIFDSVEVSTRTTQCPDLENAYFSAWNGEYKVKYTQDHKSSGGGISGNDNETIKGLYMKLDENIIFDQQFAEISHTDTYGNSTYLVNFLGFWDNGVSNTWGIPKAFTYHVMIPTSDETEVTTKTYKEYDGVKYEVSKEFVVYDNSDLESIENQTPVAMEGYNHIATVIDKLDYDEDHANGKLESVDYYFYYDANGPYILNFWNLNDYMVDGAGEQFDYGASLSKFKASDNNTFMTEGYTWNGETYGPYYPNTLEPGAYEFKGWYTTSECYDDTKINWETMTMPDNDLTVYAKWEPVKYNAYFYLDYDRYLTKTVYQTVTDISHGTAMTDPLDIPGHDSGSDYQFVGWFYINAAGEKTAFNPNEMAVRQELHLYAEWSTRTVKEYKVSYAKGEEVTAEDGTTTITPTSTLLSADTTGYAFEASTRTFTAKPSDQLELLSTDDLAEGIWVPNTNSHSILMKSDNTQNVFTFYYVCRETIPYTVRYLDATTMQPVAGDREYPENKTAVVTEQFVYVAGYIPDTFHKTLVLSANEEENVIVFYYTKDDTYQEDTDDDEDNDPDQQSARYLITHYIQDIDADTYSVYTTEDLTGIVDSTAVAYEIEIPGFTFDKTATEQEGSIKVKETENGIRYIEGTITTGGESNEALKLELYYKRNQYAYTIQCQDTSGNELRESTKTEEVYYFDDVIEIEAPKIENYYLVGDEIQTLRISTTESLNVVTFVYALQPVTVYYVPVCRNSGAQAGENGFGTVLDEWEYGSYVKGTTAVAGAGFRFIGWFSDSDYTTRVSSDAFYKPEIVPDATIKEYTYYAMFEPITLTIFQTGIPAGETALYRITGNGLNLTVALPGNGDQQTFVTIEQIPAGDYTVTELTSWTWKYAVELSASVNVTTDGTNTVAFEFSNPSTDWLHGEMNGKKKFDIYVAPTEPEDSEETEETPETT